MLRDVKETVRDTRTLGYCETVKPPAAPELRKPAPFPEELSVSVIQAFQRSALYIHRHRRHFMNFPATFRQGFALVYVGNGFACPAVAVDPLLRRRVIQLLLRVERLLQPAPVLLLLREQPIGDVAVYVHALFIAGNSHGIKRLRRQVYNRLFDHPMAPCHPPLTSRYWHNRKPS